MKADGRQSFVRWHFDFESEAIVFSGRLHPLDLAELHLDEMDRLVLATPILTGADLLQNLELVFRRMAQQGGHS
jgi:hypothetical protein